MLKFEIYKRTLYEDNNILNVLNIENDTSFRKSIQCTSIKARRKKNIAYILKHVILKPRTYIPVSFNFKVAKEILHLDSLFFLLMVQNYSIK